MGGAVSCTPVTDKVSEVKGLMSDNITLLLENTARVEVLETTMENERRDREKEIQKAMSCLLSSPS